MIDLECGLIFCMMKNAQAFLDASIKITPDMFSDVHAKELFETLKKMSEEGEPFDEPLIKAKISDSCKIFFDENIKWCYTDSKSYEIYIQKILDNSRLKLLISLGPEIEEKIKNEANLADIISLIEDKVLSVAENAIGSEMVILEDALKDFVNNIKAGKEKGISTTLKELDEMTNGFTPGQLIVIAGRPGMGKSALAMQIAYYNSLKNNVPFGVILLEMSNEELLERLVSNVANIESWKLKTGKLSDTDWDKFEKFHTDFKKAPFYFDDIGTINISTLRAKAKRLKMKNKNLGGLVVDYLQLMESGNNKNRVEEVSEISRGLKILAKELKIPIIAVSQLSRKVEDRENKRPILSDLRESGSIEQDADMVIMIYRDDYYREDKSDQSLVDLLVAKQRNGPTGSVKSIFNRSFQRFTSV